MFKEKRYPSWLDPKRIYNFKKQGSTLKGDVAEVIVKHKINFGHRPREISPTFLDEIRNFTVPDKMKEFLKENWYTVDLFSFVIKNNQVRQLELYEVKARNWYDPSYKGNLKKPQMTANALRVYSQAMQLGFIVKYAEVLFLDQWEYYIFFKDFDPENFYIRDEEDPKYAKNSNGPERGSINKHLKK
mgnify:CR=1 FL=1|jgi:hypothetical protein|tara:strand:+ start:1415 stop:1975 length:561 start_codon:yes stop_codon:yes gene_type:complete